jgi:hypothetical protein
MNNATPKTPEQVAYLFNLAARNGSEDVVAVHDAAYTNALDTCGLNSDQMTAEFWEVYLASLRCVLADNEYPKARAWFGEHGVQG